MDYCGSSVSMSALEMQHSLPSLPYATASSALLFPPKNLVSSSVLQRGGCGDRCHYVHFTDEKPEALSR